MYFQVLDLDFRTRSRAVCVFFESSVSINSNADRAASPLLHCEIVSLESFVRASRIVMTASTFGLHSFLSCDNALSPCSSSFRTGHTRRSRTNGSSPLNFRIGHAQHAIDVGAARPIRPSKRLQAAPSAKAHGTECSWASEVWRPQARARRGECLYG